MQNFWDHLNNYSSCERSEQFLETECFLNFDTLQISYTGTYICEAIDHMDMPGSTISVYLRVTESKI